ncbi:MAG: PAS domain S-box protein [Croceibacterium sp.]
MVEVRDFYEALVESSDDAIVAKDTDGIVISWNPAAETLFGWSAAEMVGQSIRRLLPDDRQHEEDEILARVRNGEKVGQFFTKRLHKDGTLLDISVAVSPVRDGQGNIVGASKIARDVGDYVRAQEKLRESEERFRLLAENMSQFAWMADAEGRIFWYNQRWTEYTGLTADEMGAGGRHKVLHPDEADRVYADFRAAIESGRDYEDIFPLRGKDGQFRWFLARATPIRDGRGRITRWFGTNTDITEQREQAEQIRLLLMEVNHRSKNMLSTIQSLARRSAPDDQGFLRRFEDRVRSLAVNQDILIARAWREVPAGELVRRQLDFLEQSPGEISIVGPELALAPRAAEVIGMALHELATNSLKYGALAVPAGRVEIGWSRREDGTGLVFWWRESDGPSVREPADTGFGTTLIRDVPRHNLDAEVDLNYLPEGLCWEIRLGDSALANLVPAAA